MNCENTSSNFLGGQRLPVCELRKVDTSTGASSTEFPHRPSKFA
jgi:hypothetical protein